MTRSKTLVSRVKAAITMSCDKFVSVDECIKNTKDRFDLMVKDKLITSYKFNKTSNKCGFIVWVEFYELDNLCHHFIIEVR